MNDPTKECIRYFTLVLTYFLKLLLPKRVYILCNTLRFSSIYNWWSGRPQTVKRKHGRKQKDVLRSLSEFTIVVHRRLNLDRCYTRPITNSPYGIGRTKVGKTVLVDRYEKSQDSERLRAAPLKGIIYLVSLLTKILQDHVKPYGCTKVWPT